MIYRHHNGALLWNILKLFWSREKFMKFQFLTNKFTGIFRCVAEFELWKAFDSSDVQFGYKHRIEKCWNLIFGRKKSPFITFFVTDGKFTDSREIWSAKAKILKYKTFLSEFNNFLNFCRNFLASKDLLRVCLFISDLNWAKNWAQQEFESLTIF